MRGVAIYFTSRLCSFGAREVHLSISKEINFRCLKGTLVQYPPEVQIIADAITSLPGVTDCICRPRPLEDFKPSDLSLPGDFGDLPQAAIIRTGGGRAKEVLFQTEVILNRSPGAWLTIEFLAWWARDWGRSGHEIQMRPMALPPMGTEIQLGNTLSFLIEYFLLETDDSYEDTLAIAAEMGTSIAQAFEYYQECFESPVAFEEGP
jgi:hypothetical protein